MAKRPKRRKYKDNPYTLLHDEENNTIFRYNAGNIGKGLYLFNKDIFFDSYDIYVLEVFFNENNKVESTILQYVP